MCADECALVSGAWASADTCPECGCAECLYLVVDTVLADLDVFEAMDMETCRGRIFSMV